MIWESRYWKDELLRYARDLRKRRLQRRWTEDSFGRLERNIMLGFFTIRKLMDSRRLSDSTMRLPIKISRFPGKGTHVTLFNSSQVDKHFDFRSQTDIAESLLFVCNQVIHSYVFEFENSPNGSLSAVLFTSDRHRRRHLFRITVGSLIRLFDRVGRDYPTHMTATFSAEKGDYVVHQKAHRGRLLTSDIADARMDLGNGPNNARSSSSRSADRRWS